MYEYKKKDLLETLESEKNTAVPFFLLIFYKDKILRKLDSLEGDLKPQINLRETELRERFPSIQLTDAYINSDSNLDITISYKTIKDITQTCHVVIPREKLFAPDPDSAFKLTDKDYSDVLIECTDEFWKDHGKDEFDKSFPINFVYNEQSRYDKRTEFQTLFSYPEKVKGYKIKDWTMRMVLGILDVYHFEPFPVKFNGNTYLLDAKIPAFSEDQARKILLKRLYDGFTLYNQDHCYQCEKYLDEKENREWHNKRRAEKLEWQIAYNIKPDKIGEERKMPEICKLYECKDCDFLPKNYFKDSYTASYFIDNKNKFKFTAIPRLDNIKLKEVTQGATAKDFFHGFGRKYRETLVPYKCVENEQSIASHLIDLETVFSYGNKSLNSKFYNCNIDNFKFAFALSLAAELGLKYTSKQKSFTVCGSIYSPINFSGKKAINQNPFMLFLFSEEKRNEILFSFIKKVEEGGIYAYKALTDSEKEFYTAQLKFNRDFYKELPLLDFFALFGDKNRPFTDSPFFQFLLDNRDFASSFDLSTQTMNTSAMLADYIRGPFFNRELSEEERKMFIEKKLLKDIHKNISDFSENYINWAWSLSSQIFDSEQSIFKKYLKYGCYLERLQNKINEERSLYLSKKITEEDFEKHIYSLFKATMGKKEFSKKICKKYIKHNLPKLFYSVNDYKLKGGVINPSLKDKGIEYIYKEYGNGTVSFEIGSIEDYVMKINDESARILLETLFAHQKKH